MRAQPTIGPWSCGLITSDAFNSTSRFDSFSDSATIFCHFSRFSNSGSVRTKTVHELRISWNVTRLHPGKLSAKNLRMEDHSHPRSLPSLDTDCSHGRREIATTCQVSSVMSSSSVNPANHLSGVKLLDDNQPAISCKRKNRFTCVSLKLEYVLSFRIS